MENRAHFIAPRHPSEQGDFTYPLTIIAGYEDKPDEKYQKLANKVEYSLNAIQSGLDNLAIKVQRRIFQPTIVRFSITVGIWQCHGLL